MYTGIIYKYENVVNHKVYIGQTTRPREREELNTSHAPSLRKTISIMLLESGVLRNFLMKF